MRAVSSLLCAAAPLFALAAPLRRAAPADILVANFANTLEQLESQFYEQAIAKFTEADLTSAGYTSAQVPLEQFKNIQIDEATHAKTLNSSIKALGGQLIEGCQFDFSSALTDVATMAATARVVEAVGVGAYIGASILVEDKVLLAAAASILTVEARHQTMLNVLSGTGSAIPAAFDIALQPPEVLAIAGPFISGCDVGVKANPSLKITNTGVPSAGTLLTFSSDAMPSDTSSLHCHMLVGGAVNSISLPYNSCNVPATVNGPVAIWVTKSPQPLVGNVKDRDTSADLVAGPALAFIDAKPEAISALVRTPSSGSGNGTATSEDISPAEASGVASSGDSSSGSGSGGSGGPNLATGPSSDGEIDVAGWSNLIST